MPSGGEAAPGHLSAPDLVGTSDSADVLLTRGAQIWARPRVIAYSGWRRRVAPYRWRLGTAPWCAHQEPQCWALEKGYPQSTSGEIRHGAAHPGYLSTGSVTCCGEVEFGEPMSRVVQVGL
jgi:hypothetical protein